MDTPVQNGLRETRENMRLSILRGLASRCARDANPRGMAECEKRVKTCGSPFREGWRPVVHGTPTLAEWKSARNKGKHAAVHSEYKVYMRLLGAVPKGGSKSRNSAAKRFLEKLQEKKESHGAVPIGGTKKYQKPCFRKNVPRILAAAPYL